MPADVNKENEEVTFRSRTKSESRSKGDNRRLYTIYDTEDDGAVLNQYLDDDRGSRAKSGYKSDTTRGTYKSDGGLNKVNKDKSGKLFVLVFLLLCIWFKSNTANTVGGPYLTPLPQQRLKYLWIRYLRYLAARNRKA